MYLDHSGQVLVTDRLQELFHENLCDCAPHETVDIEVYLGLKAKLFFNLCADTSFSSRVKQSGTES